jgi:hypothetical protein
MDGCNRYCQGRAVGLATMGRARAYVRRHCPYKRQREPKTSTARHSIAKIAVHIPARVALARDAIGRRHKRDVIAHAEARPVPDLTREVPHALRQMERQSTPHQ